MNDAAFRCSVESEALAEPIAGTASTVRSWLLLEHAGPWGRDGLRDARLPDGIGDELRRRGHRDRVRVLLIRRPHRRPGDSVTVFAIRSGPGAPWIEHGSIDRIEDALDLDTGALGRGDRVGLEPHSAPLFLICTHGRRDPCCAERGRPVAAAVATAFPEETWESSHVGGDRFAGNLVAFPHGLYFGRLDDGTAPLVARAYVGGEISLAHHRGRSCFAMDVQAAEQVLRVERGITGVDAVRVINVRREGAMTTAVFTVGQGRTEVTIERTEAPLQRLTCHAERARAAAAYQRIAVKAAG
jgi:hypothetical protein